MHNLPTVLPVLQLQRSEGRTIHATADRIAIKHHRYESIKFQDFVQGLVSAKLPSFPLRSLPARTTVIPPMPPADGPVTLEGLFRHLDTVLTEKTLVIADVGESLFAAADLHVRHCFESRPRLTNLVRA